MARIRTIKPELWTDAKIVHLPFETRLLFIGIWNFCDDEGCIADEPESIRLQVLPADHVDSGEMIERLLSEGLLERWETCEGRPFLRVTHFSDHQRVSHPVASKFTPKARRLQGVRESSGEIPRPPEDSALKGREGKGIEGKGREGMSQVASDSDALSGEVEDRPEVSELCTLLADAVAHDGTKRPDPHQKGWQDECRRLLDLDGASVEQVRYVIRWTHEPGNFWAANVMSMRKLRQKWSQLVKEIRRTSISGSTDRLREWANDAA